MGFAAGNTAGLLSSEALPTNFISPVSFNIHDIKPTITHALKSRYLFNPADGFNILEHDESLASALLQLDGTSVSLTVVLMSLTSKLQRTLAHAASEEYPEHLAMP